MRICLPPPRRPNRPAGPIGPCMSGWLPKRTLSRSVKLSKEFVTVGVGSGAGRGAGGGRRLCRHRPQPQGHPCELIGGDRRRGGPALRHRGDGAHLVADVADGGAEAELVEGLGRVGLEALAPATAAVGDVNVRCRSLQRTRLNRSPMAMIDGVAPAMQVAIGRGIGTRGSTIISGWVRVMTAPGSSPGAPVARSAASRPAGGLADGDRLAGRFGSTARNGLAV